ncbi:MAG: DUF309 domain-containing protein [Planctomycetota bacterium]
MSAPRYAPSRELPPYRYVPGRGLPHPVNDPDGHSYQEDPDAPSDPWEAQDWPTLEDFLYGVDLYNHGYWWEAHEAFEGVWQVAPTKDTGELLQGLIQIAVALLKAWQGQKRPARNLLDRGRARWDTIGTPLLMGIDREAVLRDAEAFIQARARGAQAELPWIRLVFPE